MSDVPTLGYSRPDSLEGVFAALGRPGARIYAGGSDLLVALNQREAWVESVRELVDIKGLEEAQGIDEAGDDLRVGALVTAEELAVSPLVRRFAPALAQAAALTSSPMLRRRGTIGGNLVTPHPAGDVATALLALGAVADLATSPWTVRTTAIATLLGPGSETLDPQTLILRIRVSKCPASAFEKAGLRRAFSRSVAAVAVARRGGSSQVAVGGLAERPFVAETVAARLDAGGDLDQALATDCRRFGAGDAPAALRRLRPLIERAHARASGRL